MVSDFKTKEMDDQVYGLQPGDYTDIVLNLKNDYDETVDWYMTNKVLKSLEDTRAEDTGLQGGAYSYILTFKNTSTGKETVLFSSDRVGGEGESKSGVGLHQATGALQDWFYLDTFKKKARHRAMIIRIPWHSSRCSSRLNSDLLTMSLTQLRRRQRQRERQQQRRRQRQEQRPRTHPLLRPNILRTPLLHIVRL